MNLSVERLASEANSNRTLDEKWMKSFRKVLLEMGAKSIQGQEADSVGVSLTFTLSHGSTECIKVCVGDNHGNQICGCL